MDEDSDCDCGDCAKPPRYFRKPPPRKPQNIVRKLMIRELGATNTRGRVQPYVGVRSFYQNVFPSHTIVNVEHPPCYLRKFTLDGHRLLAFSIDQMSVLVFDYMGAGAGNHLLKDVKLDSVPTAGSSGVGAGGGPPVSQQPAAPVNGELGEFVRLDLTDNANKGRPTNNSASGGGGGGGGGGHQGGRGSRHGQNENVRSKLFGEFFKLRSTTCISRDGECLNRECSLFTSDSKFVIVASASYHIEEPGRRQNAPVFTQQFRNNESLSPCRTVLENYTIYVVNLVTGKLTDTRRFIYDKISLSHNQGIYLVGNKISVLSLQHQTIHIYEIDTDTGKLVDLIRVGHYCSMDEKRDMQHVIEWNLGSRHHPDDTPRTSVSQEPMDYVIASNGYFDPMLTVLKQRLLSFMFRGAHQISLATNCRVPIASFYAAFDRIKAMRIWRMQLFGENVLLLKYSSEDVANQTHSDPNSKICLFVFFDYVKVKVLQVFCNDSLKFLRFFEVNNDLFRNTALPDDHLHFSQFTCTPANNYVMRENNERFKKSVINAKYRYGGRVEAIKRLLSQVPISAQSYSCSPYLDLSLYSYDDKWVSMLERPKTCPDSPIRFFQRDTGCLRFRLHAGPTRQRNINTRRLVAFIFHPSDPFAISVQRANSEYNVNFHARIDPGLHSNF